MLLHVAEHSPHLRLNSIPLYVFFICPSINTGCFHILATVNSTAINMGVLICLGDSDFSYHR